MALVFDLDHYRPVFLKSIDGSVRDVKSPKKVLDEIRCMASWYLIGDSHYMSVQI